MYIIDVLKKKKITREKLDNYTVKLCNSIMTDNYIKNFNNFFCKNNITINFIKNLIKNVVHFHVLVSCMNFLKNCSNLGDSKLEKILDFIKGNKSLLETHSFFQNQFNNFNISIRNNTNNFPIIFNQINFNSSSNVNYSNMFRVGVSNINNL